MPRWLLILATVGAATIAGAAADPPGVRPPGQVVAGPAAVLHPDSLPVEDPFPIRRVRATEQQLAEAQKQLEAGPVVRLPRGEFDARVRSAGRAAAEARLAPRIADARYRAALVEGDLVGTAELEVVHTGTAPRFFPLEPLRLALGPATWGDGREAVVTIAPGGTVPAVWLDRPGRHTLKFGWSAVGIAEPGERRFEFRVPTVPTALLALDLPAGQVPAVPAAEVLLTGPFPTGGNPPRAEWRVRFGGRSRLDVAVRPAGHSGVPAAATLIARYDAAPGQLACSFEYDLRPATGTVGEWLFTVDPGLRIADVVMNNRAGWTVDPAPAPNAPRKLRVALRQPGAGGKVVVTAVAPFPDTLRPGDAPLPVVRPVGAVLDDETVEVRVHPGLCVANWNPGDYRPVDSQTLSDQTRSLTLTGTLLPPGTDRQFRKPPLLATAAVEHDFTTTEDLAWRFDAHRSSAALRVALRVRRGPVFSFALRVPQGYSLGRVTSVPDELISYSQFTNGKVLVEFARPLTTGQSAELVFEFRGPDLPPGRHRLPFPVFTPVAARERNGVVAVYPGSVWAADAWAGTGTSWVGWLDPFTPRHPSGAAAVFRYAGGDADGGVVLVPAKPEYAVTAETPTDQPAGEAFTIEVRSGALPFVLAACPSGGPERSWRVLGGGNAVAAAERIPLGPLLANVLRRASPWPVDLWVVALARPATGALTLATAPTSREGRTDPTHRLTILGASTISVGARPTPKPERATGSQTWGFRDLYLLTAVRSPSDVVGVFGGSATSVGGAKLPVTLPPGAEVLSVAVEGKWAAPGSIPVTAGGVLELPVPARSTVRFEVRYRLPPDGDFPVALVRSPEPGLPVPAEVGRWWAFGPTVLAGWPVLQWDRGSAADLPALLGGLPLGGPSALVSRANFAQVRVAPAGTASAAGGGVAALLLALGWGAGRRRHPFCGLLLLTGLFALAAAVHLGPPWWQRAALAPLVVGLAVAGGVVVVRGHRRGIAVVGVVLAGWAAFDARITAQQPAPTTVILVSPDREGRETVAVPKTVLDRLAAIRPAAPGVVLTTAEYVATADDSSARVVAKFTAHALTGDEPVASLALPDARLERVTVNGANAFPATPRPGVYAVPLPGPGRHEIEVRFTVAIAGAGPEREVRFGIPEVPATRLIADLPGSARQAQAVGRIGRQVVAPGGRVRLEADLGPVKQFHARWRDGAGGAATIKVREGCIWDVSEDGAELTACYVVRVEQGTVTSVRFEIPAELEPLALAVRSLDPGGTAALRDWSLAPEQGGFRPLKLDLQDATGGRLLVVLTLAPQKAVTRQPLLRFPKVVLPGGAAPLPDAAYGLRVKGVAIEELGRAGVIDFSPDALTKEFAGVVELRLDPNAPVRVFRPTVRGGAELRPTLRVLSDPPGLTLDTLWHLGPKRAVAAGTVKWVGAAPQALLELGLEGVTVTEVRGAEVAGWAQPDGRLQVWLQRAVKEGEVSWTGTVASPQLPFEAKTPRVTSAGRLVSDAVRVRPADGFDLVVERDRGWTHGPASGHQLSYRTATASFPPVRVALDPARGSLAPADLGWLAPSPRASVAADPSPTAKSRPEIVPPTPGVAPQPQPASESAARWLLPLSLAVGWAAAFGLLLLMAACFQRATWPEQLGLVAGFFGLAVGVGGWVGVPVWCAARVVWLAEAVARGLRTR
jgi:hypothetical protein